MGTSQIESESDRQTIWAASIASTALGVTIAIWMLQSSDSISVAFLGIAHALAFVPAMVIAKVKRWKMTVASLVCITFPVWGFTFLGALTGAIGAPIANGVIWGGFVAWVFGRPSAIVVFVVIGIVTNAALFGLMSFYNMMVNQDGGFAETVGLWYILTLPAFPIILGLLPMETNDTPKDQCAFCGYSLVGLPEDVPCPECGHALFESEPNQ